MPKYDICLDLFSSAISITRSVYLSNFQETLPWATAQGEGPVPVPNMNECDEMIDAKPVMTPGGEGE